MTITFTGGLVADGTGAAAFRADVTVADGRITALTRPGEQRPAAQGRRIDVSGLVVAPGFIDMHAHSDLALLTDPVHEAKVTQGVTLEVVGQDGLSYAPVDDTTVDQLRRQLAGWNGDPPDLDIDWRTVGEYLDRLDKGCAVNVAYLVPHGTVRLLVLGTEPRVAGAEELARMCELVDAGMREGAVGLSAGLTYTPGMYADDAELVALCRVVAGHGGYYSPHHRSYGRGALDAYREQIDIARAAGVPLHFAHATLNFGVNAGRAPELLRLVDEAIASGVDVSLDSYPYLAGSTYLHALLPSWAHAGGQEALLSRLCEPGDRERIRVELEETGSDGHHGMPVDWSKVVVAGVEQAGNADAVGRSIADLAAAAGRRATDYYLDLLLADRLGSTCLENEGNEENVRAIMRHPAHTVGSDGILVGAKPHPRAWGTFPRYLGHYARSERILSLEQCVAKMTSIPARRLRLRDRGRVAPGMWADLVVFDPRTITDRATYDQPRRRSTGVVHVLVNGQFAVFDTEPTGRRAGFSVRGNGTTAG